MAPLLTLSNDTLAATPFAQTSMMLGANFADQAIWLAQTQDWLRVPNSQRMSQASRDQFGR
jgi:hypothetical protein